MFLLECNINNILNDKISYIVFSFISLISCEARAVDDNSYIKPFSTETNGYSFLPP